MTKAAIVVGGRDRQGPGESPVFELPAVPEIGSDITCTQIQSVNENLVVFAARFAPMPNSLNELSTFPGEVQPCRSNTAR